MRLELVHIAMANEWRRNSAPDFDVFERGDATLTIVYREDSGIVERARLTRGSAVLECGPESLRIASWMRAA